MRTENEIKAEHQKLNEQLNECDECLIDDSPITDECLNAINRQKEVLRHKISMIEWCLNLTDEY